MVAVTYHDVNNLLMCIRTHSKVLQNKNISNILNSYMSAQFQSAQFPDLAVTVFGVTMKRLYEQLRLCGIIMQRQGQEHILGMYLLIPPKSNELKLSASANARPCPVEEVVRKSKYLGTIGWLGWPALYRSECFTNRSDFQYFPAHAASVRAMGGRKAGGGVNIT